MKLVDLTDGSVSQRTLKVGSHLLEARERPGRSPLEVSEGAWPCRHLGVTLLASRTEAINFSCFKPLSLWQP